MKQRLLQENLVTPYDPARVKQGAYELAMGSEAFITSHVSNGKQKLELRDTVVIPPGQFGLLLTEEMIRIPADAIGFISIRAKTKFKGLVNVSGFHVDPGFSGFLKFSVYNAGSQEIRLSRGEAYFLIWFSSLDSPTSDLYNSGQRVDNRITSKDETRLQGDIASPGSLKKEIETLRSELSTLKSIGISLLVGLALLLVKVIVDWTQGSTKSSVTYIEYDRPFRELKAPDENKPSPQGTQSTRPAEPIDAKVGAGPNQNRNTTKLPPSKQDPKGKK